MAALAIRPLLAEELSERAAALARILSTTVAGGGALGFVEPLPSDDARRWFEEDVFPRVQRDERVLFGAFVDEALMGSVQLLLALPPNQRHRAEIAKMMVHPSARRQGLGKRLLQAALDEARRRAKRLVTLDTRTGGGAEKLYAQMGFRTVGVIPEYALDPDGKALHGTTIMYARLDG